MYLVGCPLIQKSHSITSTTFCWIKKLDSRRGHLDPTSWWDDGSDSGRWRMWPWRSPACLSVTQSSHSSPFFGGSKCSSSWFFMNQLFHRVGTFLKAWSHLRHRLYTESHAFSFENYRLWRFQGLSTKVSTWIQRPEPITLCWRSVSRGLTWNTASLTSSFWIPPSDACVILLFI